MGFPSARYTVRVVLFAPVEYLTYGIPPSPIFGGVMVPRKRNRLFLGRFKGVCKGAGFPRESSEAIRVGKGGTTERTRPVRRKRRTG